MKPQSEPRCRASQILRGEEMAELHDLVSAAKKGDKNAFSQLYQEIYKELYKFALYCLKDEQDAEDAVSEAVLDAWQGMHRLRQDDAFRPWMFKILSAKCKRRMRAYVRHRSETNLEDLEIPVSGGFESGESMELRSALNQLSDEERLILSLVITGGYDSGEVASMLRMNRNTVRSKQSRALAKLKTMLSSG